MILYLLKISGCIFLASSILCCIPAGVTGYLFHRKLRRKGVADPFDSIPITIGYGAILTLMAVLFSLWITSVEIGISTHLDHKRLFKIGMAVLLGVTLSLINSLVRFYWIKNFLENSNENIDLFEPREVIKTVLLFIFLTPCLITVFFAFYLAILFIYT